MAGHRQQPGTETLGRDPSEQTFRPFPSPIRKRLGIVCAGGGVTGAIYEIGALAALEDRLENVSITDFDVYVGVSAGAYIAALLANGVTPGVLFRNVTRSAGMRTDIDDLALFGLNLGEIATRLATAPFTVLDAAWDFYKNRRETTLTDLVQSLGQLLPSGVFHNEGLEAWMQSGSPGGPHGRLPQPGKDAPHRRRGPRHGRDGEVRRPGHRGRADLESRRGVVRDSGPLPPGEDQGARTTSTAACGRRRTSRSRSASAAASRSASTRSSPSASRTPTAP